MCVCECERLPSLPPCFLKRAPRLILVGDAFGLMAAFLELNGVYLIHIIDTRAHTHTGTHTYTDIHTWAKLLSFLRVLCVGSRPVADATDRSSVVSTQLRSLKCHHECDVSKCERTNQKQPSATKPHYGIKSEFEYLIIVGNNSGAI